MDYPAILSFLKTTQLRKEATNWRSYLTYKNVFGLLDIRMEDYFQLRSTKDDYSITRGNPYKLFVNYCRINVRKISLSNVL